MNTTIEAMTTYKLPEPAFPPRWPGDMALYTVGQMQAAYNQGRIDERKEQEELERIYDSVRVAMNNERKAR